MPLLVQLFFWYALITENLPGPREALQPLPGVFLTNRGIVFPTPWSTPVLSGFNFTGGAALTPGVRRAAGRPRHLHRRLHRRDRARGRALGGAGQVEAAHSLGLRAAARCATSCCRRRCA